MSDASEHREWDERLQDWLDDDLDAAQSMLLREHIESCSDCRARLKALQAIDAELSRLHERTALETSFDRQLFERITCAERADRAAARVAAERQWRDGLQRLSRQSHEAWRWTILNVLAGAAVLGALISSLLRLSSPGRPLDRFLPVAAHSIFAHPVIVLPIAAGFAAVALGLVRSLASRER